MKDQGLWASERQTVGQTEALGASGLLPVPGRQQVPWREAGISFGLGTH